MFWLWFAEILQNETIVLPYLVQQQILFFKWFLWLLEMDDADYLGAHGERSALLWANVLLSPLQPKKHFFYREGVIGDL